jgi:hypothetical protein
MMRKITTSPTNVDTQYNYVISTHATHGYLAQDHDGEDDEEEHNQHSLSRTTVHV